MDEIIRRFSDSQLMWIKNSDTFYEYFESCTAKTDLECNETYNCIFDELEKDIFTKTFYSMRGWVANPQSIEAIKLKKVSNMLGFSSNLYSHYKSAQDYADNIKFTSDEELCLKSIYIKQKLMTAKLLYNNKINSDICLYRGLDEDYELDIEYKPCNMESWTFSVDKAKKFAGENGHILKIPFDVNHIFAYRNSIYKPKNAIEGDIWRYVAKESECIVEWNEAFVLKLNENIFRYVDLE